MSTIAELNLIVLLFFAIPVAIYVVCSRIFRKPLLNIPIFIVLLLAFMFWNIFGYDIKYGNEIDFAENIRIFFVNDSSMIAWFAWLPAIAGFLVANFIGFVTYFVKRRHSK